MEYSKNNIHGCGDSVQPKSEKSASSYTPELGVHAEGNKKFAKIPDEIAHGHIPDGLTPLMDHFGEVEEIDGKKMVRIPNYLTYGNIPKGQFASMEFFYELEEEETCIDSDYDEPERSDGELIEPNEERRTDKPVGAVQDSPQPENKELFDLMIFDDQESREQGYDPMTDVLERSDVLRTGTFNKSTESHDTSGTTDAPTESAVSVEQDNTVPMTNLLGQFVKRSEDKREIDLTKGLSETLKEEKSLIAIPQQVPSQTEGMQLQEQYKVEEIDAISGKPNPYFTARKVMDKVSLRVVDECLYAHNGIYYQLLSENDAQSMIVNVCREEVADAGGASHARRVYDMLLIEPELKIHELESKQRVISFQNRALLLDTGELVPNAPSLFTTYGLQCNYLSGNPECPRFDQFLVDITGGDAELIERVWQMMGYAISPDTRGKALFLLQGVPNSGKSVLSALLSSLFNREAVLSLDVHELGSKYVVSNLMGKALYISPDMPSEALDNKVVSKLKQLTGEDVVSSDVKYKDRVQFRNTAKIVLASNHPLLIKGRDEAFFERVIVIPFNYSTPKERQDKFLLERLKGERDAIATKAISAYYRLIGQRYRFCGNYPLNECVGDGSQNGVSGGDMATRIHTFLQSYFTGDKDSIVHVNDAHRLFTGMGNEIALNTFSKYFCESANELYGGEHDRKRKSGEQNALSCVKGIRFIGEGGRM